MRAMILAAGRGARMRSLTSEIPKPLLEVNGRSFIAHHLAALSDAGIKDIVINLGYLGNKIEETIGTGIQFGVQVQYSYEDPILETGGGIKKALSLLGNDPFVAVSGDVLTDFPFATLPKDPAGLVHLVLTDNPPHHVKGDYSLQEGYISDMDNPNHPKMNFSGIAVYRPELFVDSPEGAFPIARLFQKAIKERLATGEYYQGLWHNIGTPEQLAAIKQR